MWKRGDVQSLIAAFNIKKMFFCLIEMTILYVLYDLYCVHFFVYLCVVLLWLKQVFCLQIKVKKNRNMWTYYLLG